ncbi:MAG: chromate transporter [Clostridia bacterium]|nr:chromate transporter [Clostridia bacterium]
MMYLLLFFTFFKIGAFTFGGGYAMLPLIQEEVLANGWVSMEELINFVAIAESTPGPFAVNIATYVGTELAGIPGGICATLGVVLPSFLIILLVAGMFEKFKANKIVAGCMSGLKPAAIGLIASAVLTIGKTVFFPETISTSVFLDVKTYVSLAIFGMMSVLAFRQVSPILIILLSAGMGIVIGFMLG